MNNPSFAVDVVDVTLCTIMFHLGLNKLIIEMFRYLFSVVSQNPYSEDVNASLQKIMNAILDEKC
jgi:hypothetical protein